MTAKCISPGELPPTDRAGTRGTSQVHARDVLAEALVVHLAAATLSAAPVAHAALLVLPWIHGMAEVVGLEVTYDAGRGEIVEGDATYPSIPGASCMRRAMPRNNTSK